MKVLITTVALATTLAWCLAGAMADERGGPGGGGRGMGGAAGNVQHADGGGVSHADHAAGGEVDHADHATDNSGGEAERGVNHEADRNNADNDRNNRSNNDVRNDRSNNDVRNNRSNNDRRGNEHLGARDFDRNGIGRLDADRFRGRNDNGWRYARFNNSWWYWQPGGYWVWWNANRWNRYDADTYYDNYNNQPAVATNASGPYYEDQGGFFSYENGQKVYDPQIERVKTSASRPGPESR